MEQNKIKLAIDNLNAVFENREELKSETLKISLEALSKLENYNNLQTPMKPIMDNWCPSKCPGCNKDFYDYEDCDDGYYDRAYPLERCPFCGQKLDWFKEDHI